ncbi:MAG: hypothetical protein S4CHLAM37_11280 [Chlamydiia bacterium]|nr:hypothetical protein [Chlamydiia bacterium]
MYISRQSFSLTYYGGLGSTKASSKDLEAPLLSLLKEGRYISLESLANNCFTKQSVKTPICEKFCEVVSSYDQTNHPAVKEFIRYCEDNKDSFLNQVCMKAFKRLRISEKENEYPGLPKNVQKALVHVSSYPEALNQVLHSYIPCREGDVLSVDTHKLNAHFEKLEDKFQAEFKQSYIAFLDGVIGKDDIAEKLGVTDYSKEKLEDNAYLEKVIKCFHDPSKKEVLEGITVLALNAKGISILPPIISALTGLLELDLSENKLTTLPRSIGNLTSLQKLLVDKNQLKVLPDSFGNLTALQELGLGYSQLTVLPDSFGNLTALKMLGLNESNLTILPNSFRNLVALTELYLGGNQLKELPEGFGNLSALEQLDLCENQLKKLPEGFGNLSALEVLHLHDNELKELPEGFGNLSALNELDLQGNELKELPEGFGNLSALKVLSLRNNQLKEIPGLGKLTALELIDIGNNPFNKGFPYALFLLPESTKIDPIGFMETPNQRFLETIPKEGALPTLQEVKKRIPSVEHSDPKKALLDFFHSFAEEQFEGVMTHMNVLPKLADGTTAKDHFFFLFDKVLTNIMENNRILPIPEGSVEEHYAYMKKIIKHLAIATKKEDCDKGQLLTLCLEIAKVGEYCYTAVDQKMMYVLRQTQPGLFEAAKERDLVSVDAIKESLLATLHNKKLSVLNEHIARIEGSPHSISFYKRVFSRYGVDKGAADSFELQGAGLVAQKVLEKIRNDIDKVNFANLFYGTYALTLRVTTEEDKLISLAALMFKSLNDSALKDTRMCTSLIVEAEAFFKRHLVEDTTPEKTQLFGEFLEESGVSSMYDILEYDEETYTPTKIKKLGVLKVLDHMGFFQ